MGLNMADLSQVTGKSAKQITSDWKTMTTSQKAALLDSAMEMKNGKDANEKYKESYQGLLQAGKNAFQGIEIAVGNTILPIIVPALKTAAAWTKNLGQGFTKLPGPIKDGVVAAGLLTGALLTLSGMASILKPIVTPIKAIGSAISWTAGMAKKGALAMADFVMEGRLASLVKGTTVTDTVNKVTNNITHNTSDGTPNGGGGGGSWYTPYIQPASSILTTAGAYLAGRGSSTIASIGARVAGIGAGVTLGGIARGAATLGTGIPGVGEGIMGLFEPGQMFGKSLTPYEKTATPYQQTRAEEAQSGDYDANGNYIGPNAYSDIGTGATNMALGAGNYTVGAWNNTKKFFSGPNPLAGIHLPPNPIKGLNLPNLGGAMPYLSGALGNTGAYIGGALGNTGSAISGAVGGAGSWLGKNLGFLRPGESPLNPVGAADGKSHSMWDDITGSKGILRGTGLESGGWINKGVSNFTKESSR